MKPGENVNPRSKARELNTSTKPMSAISRKAAKAPQPYRPQPTPKCLQLKAAPGQVADQASLNKQGPAAPPAYRPQPVPKVLQRKTAAVGPLSPASRRLPVTSSIQRAISPARPSRVVQRMEVRRGMQWSEFTIISMPSPKHILEKMKLVDANGSKLISVVEQAVAEDAVQAIGAHVKSKGWQSSEDITMVKNQDGSWEITYKGNRWMTHTDSGQLWPLSGPDIFSPPNDGKDMRPHIRRWKGNKLNRPQVYMNQ